jgi:2-amino-4-hydroxy-6-hydroxymethyldihydropteridine diphosphokinase
MKPVPREEIAYLSIGSNLGLRAQNLRRAISYLKNNPMIHIESVSSIYETSPVGFRQSPYLNAALKIKTPLPPDELLKRLKQIEKRLGRKPGPRWGSRTIDLDIIFYGRHKFHTSHLAIPHPQFRFRRFVLIPLLEISPRLRDPQTKRTIRQILANLTSPDQKVRLKTRGQLH